MYVKGHNNAVNLLKNSILILFSSLDTAHFNSHNPSLPVSFKPGPATYDIIAPQLCDWPEALVSVRQRNTL